MTHWIRPFLLVSAIVSSACTETTSPEHASLVRFGCASIDACIVGEVLDTSPADGLQVDCSVSQFIGGSADPSLQYIVPPCELAGPSHRCWLAVLDRDVCPASPTGLRIEVRYPEGEPDPGYAIDIQCVLPVPPPPPPRR